MEIKAFIVVIDPTDFPAREAVKSGIFGVQIVAALDKIHARKIVLSLMSPKFAEQLRQCLYVYDVEEISYICKERYKNNKLPLWSFLPLNGARPDKTDAVFNNNQMNGRISQQPQTNQLLQENTQVTPTKSRQEQFSVGEEQVGPATPNILSPEQQKIVASLGVDPSNKASYNAETIKVDTATGIPVDNTLGVEIKTASQNEVQMLLARLEQLNSNQTIVDDPQLRREIEEARRNIVENDEYNK